MCERRSQDVQSLSSLPGMMRAALSNLAQCPAWQGSGQAVAVHLISTASTPFPPDVFRQMIGELSGLSTKQVSLTLVAPGLVVGAATVAQLGSALGASLTRLHLRACDLVEDISPACRAHLPGLQVLITGPNTE
jgi:hypothetical protein